MMFLDTNVPNEPEDSIWTTHEFTTIRGELYGALPSGVTRLDRIDGNGNFVRTIWTKPASLDIKNKKMRIMPLGGKFLTELRCFLWVNVPRFLSSLHLIVLPTSLLSCLPHGFGWLKRMEN